MKRLFGNGRYANVTATLALFLALAGSSYAAIKLPANSVSTKQIKKGAVTLNRISSGARAALKGQTGARGPQGPPGPSGVGTTSGVPGSSIYAAVTSNGLLGRNSHATFAQEGPTPGTYFVTFDRNITNCVYSGTVGGITAGVGEQETPPAGSVSVNRRNVVGGEAQLSVATYVGGARTPLPFYLVVTC